jgi:rhodanese-related sulfurtransferase
MRSAIFVSLLLLSGVAQAGDAFGEMTVDQVAAKLKDKNLYLYDCNDPYTWKSGHVPGAKFVEYDNLQAKDLPADKQATLVFYCANEH